MRPLFRTIKTAETPGPEPTGRATPPAVTSRVATQPAGMRPPEIPETPPEAPSAGMQQAERPRAAMPPVGIAQAATAGPAGMQPAETAPAETPVAVSPVVHRPRVRSSLPVRPVREVRLQESPAAPPASAELAVRGVLADLQLVGARHSAAPPAVLDRPRPRFFRNLDRAATPALVISAPAPQFLPPTLAETAAATGSVAPPSAEMPTAVKPRAASLRAARLLAEQSPAAQPLAAAILAARLVRQLAEMASLVGRIRAPAEPQMRALAMVARAEALARADLAR